MIKQQSLAVQFTFEKYGRKSRRELFLDEMEQVVPWTALVLAVAFRWNDSRRAQDFGLRQKAIRVIASIRDHGFCLLTLEQFRCRRILAGKFSTATSLPCRQ